MQTSHVGNRRTAGLWQLLAAAALLASSLPMWQPIQVAQAEVTGGNITGIVFQDFNSNGVRDTSGANGTAVDVGVAGVTVSAYDANGALQGSTASSASGAYTLTATGVGPYRIEFIGLPNGFEPSYRGSGNATSVQFVADGNTSNVNFAINQPCEFCQNGAPLAEALHKIDFSFFTGVAGSEPTTTTVAVIGNSTNHLQPNNLPPFNGVTFQSNVTQTGGLWGIAWDRTRRSLYVSSVFRRETDVGPLGIGGIYTVDPFAAAQNAATFMTISNVGDPRPGGQPTIADTTAITAAGKAGLGGMDISDDDSTLYVMNLNTRRLVQVDVASKTETTSYLVPNPGCANANDVRPWAVKVYRNNVYIGVTCSGETNGTLTGQSAYVMRLSGGAFTTVGSMPLTYAKDTVLDINNICGNGWNPWSASTASLACALNTGAGMLRPEPLLSSIEFDSDGSATLGFIDRFMFKAAPQLFDFPRSGGDVRRMCNVGGVLVAEGNAGCAFKDSDEYFIGDSYTAPNWYGLTNYVPHFETATGGLAQFPGALDVAVSTYNPSDNDWNNGPGGRAAETSGVSWMSNSTGAKTKGVYTTPEQVGSYGKGGSAGDMEFLCDPAPIEIGNRIWSDTNGNGIQDPDELPIANVIVSLQTPTGTLTTQTDANGNYYFSGLRPNTAYTMTVAPGQAALTGAQLTQANANGLSNNTPITDVRDSDATLVGGTPTIYYTTGAAGQNNHGLDIGFYQPVNLGDLVWFDTNNNGSVDAGEQPVNGVAVQLYQDTNGDGVFSAGDTFISSTSTNSSGIYNFANLTPTAGSGTGYLVVLPASNFVSGGPLFNYQNSSSTVAGNSDVNNQDHGNVIGALGGAGVVASSVISLTAGGEPPANVDGSDANGNQTIDFGFYQLNLGNQVWVDSNNDGLLNNGEQGRAGVTVQLLDSNNVVIATTATDANGIYTFTNLLPGTYSVQIEMPAGFSSSSGAGQEANPDGNGDNNDNGVLINGQTARSNPITLTPGSEPTVDNANGSTTNPTMDFGIVQLASLGNYVWIDVNRDGQQNDGNTGVNGVTVTLYDVNGSAIATTTTDASGFYSFTNLVPGTYSVGFTAPAGYTFTTQGSDPASDTDSNANPITGRTAPVNLAAGENNPTLDAGLWLPAPAISLKKYVNGNDAQTAPGINVTAGSPVTWTYFITNTGNAPLTQIALTDDKLGPITCPRTELAVGEGMICTATGTAIVGQYTNLGAVTAKDATNPNGPTLTASDPANYFGAQLLASLGNYVWVDVNRDGQQGNPSIEPPLPGVTVTLYYISGTAIATTTTDANGLYQFTNLEPGTYSVGFTFPPGYTVTTKGSDPASDTDSNVNPATGRTDPVTLAGGENNPTLDAGVYLNVPGISLKKYVNGDDAQIAPGILVPVGSVVTWTYVVRNIGNVDLVNVAVTDDKEGPITCPKTTLAVNEVMTCSKTGIARQGQYTNLGAVTGRDATNPNGPTLTSSDPANYNAGLPQLVIRKRSIPVEVINGQQTVVDIGDRITYTLQVTNTGSFTATGVRISDDIPTGTQFVAGSAVPAQTSGPDPLVWNVGNLAPGATASVSFAVIVINRLPVAIQNTGRVNSNETVTATNSNTIVHVYAPTAVELIAFSVSGNRVLWTTGAELNSFGFAIYRSSTANRSDATLVSTELIAAKGGNSRYEFVDATAQAGTSYSYWLVEVEKSGATVEYGPVKADWGANGTESLNMVAVNNAVVVAGGLAVQTDGAATGMAVVNSPNASSASPAPAMQTVSAVNAEAVIAEARNQVAQPVAVAEAVNAPAVVADPPKPVAVAPSNQVATANTAQSNLKAEPSTAAAEAKTVGSAEAVAEAQPMVQKAQTVAVVAQPQAAARTSPHNGAGLLMQAAVLASVLAGVLALVGGLGFGLFVVARRKRN